MKKLSMILNLLLTIKRNQHQAIIAQDKNKIADGNKKKISAYKIESSFNVDSFIKLTLSLQGDPCGIFDTLSPILSRYQNLHQDMSLLEKLEKNNFSFPLELFRKACDYQLTTNPLNHNNISKLLRFKSDADAEFMKLFVLSVIKKLKFDDNNHDSKKTDDLIRSLLGKLLDLKLDIVSFIENDWFANFLKKALTQNSAEQLWIKRSFFINTEDYVRFLMKLKIPACYLSGKDLVDCLNSLTEDKFKQYIEFNQAEIIRDFEKNYKNKIYFIEHLKPELLLMLFDYKDLRDSLSHGLNLESIFKNKEFSKENKLKFLKSFDSIKNIEHRYGLSWFFEKLHKDDFDMLVNLLNDEKQWDGFVSEYIKSSGDLLPAFDNMKNDLRLPFLRHLSKQEDLKLSLDEDTVKKLCSCLPSEDQKEGAELLDKLYQAGKVCLNSSLSRS